MKKYTNFFTACLVGLLCVAMQLPAQEAANPKYSADAPDDILTPEIVETRWATFDFFDGMPSKHSVEKAYEFLDLSRGIEAFLNGMPAASIYALLEGFSQAGMKPKRLRII